MPLSYSITQDSDNQTIVTLENDLLHVTYGHGVRFHRERDMHESYITEFTDKRTGEDQVQHNRNGFGWSCLDAGEWHGLIRSAELVRADEYALTLRMVWDPIQGEVAIKEVSLFSGQPFLKIDYLQWDVNIFDIANPGGISHGEYAIFGMEGWKRPLTYYEQIYFDRYAGDLGYMNITEIDAEAGSLDYHGSFIMGLINPANGRGFGRVAPVESTDIFKLLFEGRHCGLELFPYYNRAHGPYVNYLYAITGGAKETIALGQQIADTRP